MGTSSFRRPQLDAAEIDRRKQFIRDLWAGRPLDHTPIHMTVSHPQPAYSTRRQFLDGDKQLQVALANLDLTWKYLPQADAVPAMRPDVGCSCLATAFGAELFWGDDENQTCGVKNPLLNSIAEVAELEAPPADAGQLAEGAQRVRRFAEAGDGLISVSLLDMAGGINVAADLLGVEAALLAMYEDPDALECLLDKIQQLFLAAIAAQIEAAGGPDAITTTDFPDTWFPEGCKGHVSDDISASFSPACYRRFSLPYHDRIFQRYGGGGLHNCGPNPCLAEYLNHTPAPRAIDLSWQYSKAEMPAIKKACRRRAFIYMLEFPPEPGIAVDTFREVMELMAPDVLVIPTIYANPEHEPDELHRELRVIAEEYARRMDWGWDQT